MRGERWREPSMTSPQSSVVPGFVPSGWRRLCAMNKEVFPSWKWLPLSCIEQRQNFLSKFKYILEHVLWPLCMSRMDCSPDFGSCVESNNSNTQGVDERLVLTLQVPLGLTRQTSQVGMKCFERAGKEPGWAFMVISGWDWADTSWVWAWACVTWISQFQKKGAPNISYQHGQIQGIKRRESEV